jgi:peptide/nickel transport system ATP-binding protein
MTATRITGTQASLEVKRDLGIAYLFISHDLSMVRYIADCVHVMHGGKNVERGDHHEISRAPRHAHTRALLDAVPVNRFDAQAA